jgi:hypothetical protein
MPQTHQDTRADEGGWDQQALQDGQRARDSIHAVEAKIERDRADHRWDCRGENSQIVGHRRESPDRAARPKSREDDHGGSERENEVRRENCASRLRGREVIPKDDGDDRSEPD